MKALLIQTSSEGNDGYSADCDYALIPMPDAADAAKLKGLVLKALWEFTMADSHSFEVSFFCPSITMLPYDVVEELYPGVTDEPDPDFSIVEMPDLSGFSELPRTECDRVHVQVDGLWWDVVPKHCEFRVTTREISFEKLEELA